MAVGSDSVCSEPEAKMVELFFSYSHRDDQLRNELEIHLSMLKRQGVISAWHDRRIAAGKDFSGAISEHLEEADIILLLVSSDFLASDYCYDIELKRALERHEQREARVIPVILRPCDWKNSSFKHLRATPPDGKPISKFANTDEAFLSVVEDIRRVANELGEKNTSIGAASGRPRPPSPRRAQESQRSSNLRVKKIFSDREKDEFRDASFEFIANFFENSLAELEERNPGVDGRFRRVDANHFTVALYQQGRKRSGCRVWLGRAFSGDDILYAGNDSGADNSWNESMSVRDDGYTLMLAPLGMNTYGKANRELLTQQGAAEYFWAILIGPLQQ